MKKNRLSVGDYTYWTVYGMVMLTFFYRRYYMISDPLGIGGLVMEIFAALVLWRMLGTASRNVTSVILIVTFPQVLSEILSFWKYAAPVRCMTIGTILLSALMCVFLSVRIGRRIPYNTKRARRYRRNRILKYFVSFACPLLLGAAVYGRIARMDHWSVMMREVLAAYNDSGSGENSDPNCLASNIETISKLDPEGGWKDLDLEQKSEVLEAIIRVECRYLGMEDVYPKLNIAYTDQDELLGYYDREKDIITISYLYMCDMNAGGYGVCQVLCHELYHRVQFYQVKMLEALEATEETRKYADLLLLHDTNVYREEASHYYSGKDNYFRYASQQLERDAEQYGNEAAMEYYQAVQEYFGNQAA